MAFVFKNYKQTKNKHEELIEIKVLESEDVFVDLPVAVVEFGVDYEVPIIFGDFKGLPRIMDAKIVLNATKMFHFGEGVENEDNKTASVVEVSEDKAKWHFRLPKDTPIDQLIVVDNQILLAEKVEDKKGE